MTPFASKHFPASKAVMTNMLGLQHLFARAANKVSAEENIQTSPLRCLRRRVSQQGHLRGMARPFPRPADFVSMGVEPH